MVRLLALAFIGAAAAFSAPMRVGGAVRQYAAVRRESHLSMAVIDIASTEEFNRALESAGESLVVVDYSTSWCGPCKIIAPKFEELSEQYKNVAFLKVSAKPAPHPLRTIPAMCLLNDDVCVGGVLRRAGDGRQQP